MQGFEIDLKHISTKDRPLFLLDGGLCCVFSSDESMIKTGTSMLTALRREVPLPITQAVDELVFINRQFYCAMLTPVQMNGEPYYICEIVDKYRAVGLFSNTDAGADSFGTYKTMEYNISQMWQTLKQLDEKDDIDAELLGELRSSVYKLSACVKNGSQYVESIFSEEHNTLFDMNKLCTHLAERCNAVLAKCGRGIDVLCSSENIFVHLDSRRTIVAMVNAVQNALLYSPADDVPLIVVDTEDECAVVRVENNNISYSDDEFSDSRDVTMSYQRTGFGIPIMRSFAERAGGSCSLEYAGGRAVLTLKLPLATEEEIACYHLEERFVGVYKTGLPDFLDIRMQEVVHIFERQKTANIQ